MTRQTNLSRGRYALTILRRAGVIWLLMCLLIMTPALFVKTYDAAQEDFSIRLRLTAGFVIYPLLAVWAGWISTMIQKRNLPDQHSISKGIT